MADLIKLDPRQPAIFIPPDLSVGPLITPPAPAAPRNALIVHPHPFTSKRIDYAVVEGASLAEIVSGCGIPEIYHAQVRVWVEDVEVPRELWAVSKPKAGRTLYVRVVPHGGKNILASLLMLVVAVVAMVVAGPIASSILGAAGITASTTSAVFLATKAIVSAGIMLVGGLLVNALIPPPKPEDGKTSQRALLTGVRNRFQPYAPIPRIYGKRRTYPLQAARPYTEALGRKRYLRALLLVGWGPLKITDLKIGETPISVFENVEYEILEGWTDNTFGSLPVGKTADGAPTLFTSSVSENNFQVFLPKDYAASENGDGWVLRTSGPNARELSVDVDFPGGLFRVTGEGKRVPWNVSVFVQYRKVGTTTWLDVVWDGNDPEDGTQTNGRLTCRDADGSGKAGGSAITFGGRWKVSEAAQYEIRLRRSDDLDTPQISDRAFWTSLRTIRYENPINIQGLCLIALRMKATDQFQSFPDEINCIAESYTPVWNGSTWAYQLTQSPAWAYADLLRRRGTERFIADSRIDLVKIKAWADRCALTAPNASEQYWRLNGTFEGGPVFGALRIAASHGRASFIISDGKYSVVMDIEQTTPVQHITPRNSWGYSGSKAFIDYPHALKVTFVNEAKGFQDDEIIVYRDGFTAANASKFETLELPLCTSATQAWRDGRYHIAVGLLRPEEHAVSMDIEGLRCEAGDLVRLTHDVISVGLGFGRIKSRITSGSNTTGFVLDSRVPMAPGVVYGIRIRKEDGSSFVATLANVSVALEANEVTLVTPVATAGAPAPGDLFMFGEVARESAPMLVKRIEPGQDMSVRIIMVDAQPGVWTADTQPIPPFDSYVTIETPVEQQKPPLPVYDLQSDEAVLERLSNGELQDRIAVNIRTPPSSLVPTDFFEVQARLTGVVAYKHIATVPYTARTVFISPVEGGDLWDVRVRAISQFGKASDWVQTLAYTVIGKTARPADVQDFAALSKTDGVQLSWTPNAELDVVGYSIRRGVNWDSGENVAEYFVGNTIFVALDTNDEVTFWIRAVDAIGLESETPVSVIVGVATPADVAAFDVYPLGDFVRFAWTPVAGNGIEYEIRNGTSWGASRVVGRAAGDNLTVRWPTRETGSPLYWIKARSSAGLYSINTRLASAAQAALPNRNIVIDNDFSADTWTGGRVGFSTSGTGAGSLLVADVVGGLTVAIADFYRKVTLPLRIYARNWIEAIAQASAGANLTWAGATFTWEGAGERTWTGIRLDNEAVELIPKISLKSDTLDAAIVEAWRLESNLTGVRGTVGSGGGETYGQLRFGNGLNAGAGYMLTLDYSYPSQFSLIFDYRLAAGARATDHTVLWLQNGSPFARVSYAQASKTWTLTPSTGAQISIVADIADGDIVTFGVVQEASVRRFFIYSRLQQRLWSGSVAEAPLLAFNRILILNARGILGDVEMRSDLLTEERFRALAEERYPVGYEPWRNFVAGDYDYLDCFVWLRARVLERSQEIVVSRAIMRVDAEDIIERGNASVAAPSSTINFTRAFNVAPEVTAVQKGGAILAIPRVLSVTKTSFTVALYDVSNPATAVAGNISFTAVGY
jgi:hypothetical protein